MIVPSQKISLNADRRGKSLPLPLIAFAEFTSLFTRRYDFSMMKSDKFELIKKMLPCIYKVDVKTRKTWTLKLFRDFACLTLCISFFVSIGFKQFMLWLNGFKNRINLFTFNTFTHYTRLAKKDDYPSWFWNYSKSGRVFFALHNVAKNWMGVNFLNFESVTHSKSTAC